MRHCIECRRPMWRGQRIPGAVQYGSYGSCQSCRAAQARRAPMPEGIRKYIADRRRRGIPAEGVLFQGEAA